MREGVGATRVPWRPCYLCGMTVELILAAIAGVGGVTSVVFQMKMSRSEARAKGLQDELEGQKVEHKLLRKKYEDAVGEIEARQLLEEVHVHAMVDLGVAKSAQQAKIEYRDRVEQILGRRPDWRPSKIKDELKWVQSGLPIIAPRIPASPANDRPHPSAYRQPEQTGRIPSEVPRDVGENGPIQPLTPPAVAPQIEAPARRESARPGIAGSPSFD